MLRFLPFKPLRAFLALAVCLLAAGWATCTPTANEGQEKLIFIQKHPKGSFELFYKKVAVAPTPNHFIRFSKIDTEQFARAFRFYAPTNTWTRTFSGTSEPLKKLLAHFEKSESIVLTLAFPSPQPAVSLTVITEKIPDTPTAPALYATKIYAQSSTLELPPTVRNMLSSIFLPDSFLGKHVGSRLEIHSSALQTLGLIGCCALPFANPTSRRAICSVATTGRENATDFFSSYPEEWKNYDYYAILGFDRSRTRNYSTVTDSQIKKAYRDLARQNHSDKTGAVTGSTEELIRKATAANDVLSNPRTRRRYNRFKGITQSPQPEPQPQTQTTTQAPEAANEDEPTTSDLDVD